MAKCTTHYSEADKDRLLFLLPQHHGLHDELMSGSPDAAETVYEIGKELLHISVRMNESFTFHDE